MMNYGGKLSLAIILGFFLTTSLLTVSIMIPERVAAYTPYAPIYIDGNEDFTAANGVTGGNGTPENPYIIEGWEINASLASVAGITIRNTDAHFIIQNVSIYSGGSLYDGIFLSNVANGRIENSTFINNYDGICFNSTFNFKISGNVFSGNLFASIHAVASEDISIIENKVQDSHYGIYLEYSENASLLQNHAKNNTYGICLNHSYDVLVDSNIIGNNTFGIYSDGTSSSSLTNNMITNNSYGIYLLDSDIVEMLDNYLADNEISIYDNSEISNNNTQNHEYLFLLIIIAAIAMMAVISLFYFLRKKKSPIEPK